MFTTDPMPGNPWPHDMLITIEDDGRRTTDDAVGRLMLNLLGAFAEFERTLIRERQREGIRIAKTAGKYKGRARKLTDDQIADAVRRVSAGVPKTTIARDLGIDRTTLYRMLSTPLWPAEQAGD